MNGCRNKSAVRKFHFQIAPQWHIWGNQSRTSYLTHPAACAVPRQSENFSAATFCVSEGKRQGERDRERDRDEESFHCFSYDSFHVLIPLRLLLGDFLHHLTRQICALRSKKPAGRSIWQCQQWAWLPGGGCVMEELRARQSRILNICLALPCLGALKPNCLAH